MGVFTKEQRNHTKDTWNIWYT